MHTKLKYQNLERERETHTHTLVMFRSSDKVQGRHFGTGELHFPSMHCKYEFPVITKLLLHVIMAILPSETIYILPLSGSLSSGHFLISKTK